MERHFLHDVMTTAHFRTLLGLFLSCAFLWSSVCCESFAFDSEVKTETIAVHVSGSHANTSTPQHCDEASGADAQDRDCDCFHPNKSLTLFTLNDSVLVVSFACAYTPLSPLQSPVYALESPVLAPEPGPPQNLMGPPVFYASTVLLI